MEHVDENKGMINESDIPKIDFGISEMDSEIYIIISVIIVVVATLSAVAFLLIN